MEVLQRFQLPTGLPLMMESRPEHQERGYPVGLSALGDMPSPIHPPDILCMRAGVPHDCLLQGLSPQDLALTVPGRVKTVPTS